MFAPRGIRNNNFGNIEDGPFARGLPGYTGTDGRFATFASPQDGLTAIDRLLTGYGRRGINSINGVVNRWAPASDGNHVGNYAGHISKVAGFGPDDPIDLNDPAVRQKLARGIAEFENGPQAFNAVYGSGAATTPTKGSVDAVSYAPRGPANFSAPAAPKTVPASQTVFNGKSDGGEGFFGTNYDNVSHALQGAGASLAAIGNPQMGAALASMVKPQDDQWQVIAQPGTGALIRINKKTGKVETVQNGIPVRSETDKAYDTAMGKSWAELNEKIGTTASASQAALGQLDHLKAALSNPNVYQGFGGESILQLKKAGQALGLNIEGIADSELAGKISKGLALELRNPSGGAGMPGALSDSDRKFLTQMVAGLDNSPQGNAQIIELYRSVHQRNIDIDRMRAEYEAKHGRIDANFTRQVRQWAQDNPLFTQPTATQAPQPSTQSGGGFRIIKAPY
jgi:hypothetical protein